MESPSPKLTTLARRRGSIRNGELIEPEPERVRFAASSARGLRTLRKVGCRLPVPSEWRPGQDLSTTIARWKPGYGCTDSGLIFALNAASDGHPADRDVGTDARTAVLAGIATASSWSHGASEPDAVRTSSYGTGPSDTRFLV